jgi:DNA-binding protein H-NS
MAKLPDLSAYSAGELHELIDAANKRIDELTKARLAELQKQKNEIESEMAKLSGGGKASSASGGARAKPPVKYRDAKGNTWTGRGATPKWLSAYEAEGRKREEFLV